MTKEEIGAILKTLRINSGKTQKQVAEAIGRTQQIIGHWETGYSQPDANTLFGLCELYGVSVDDAFGFSNKKANVLLTKSDREFIALLHMLSSGGQAKVKEYIDDLVKSGKYERESKKARPLNEQTDDEELVLPIAARSGEQVNITTTKSKLEADIKKLVPTDEEEL